VASLVTKERPNATFKEELQELQIKFGIVLRAIIF
jgi:hypothetical protein